MMIFYTFFSFITNFFFYYSEKVIKYAEIVIKKKKESQYKKRRCRWISSVVLVVGCFHAHVHFYLCFYFDGIVIDCMIDEIMIFVCCFFIFT